MIISNEWMNVQDPTDKPSLSQTFLKGRQYDTCSGKNTDHQVILMTSFQITYLNVFSSFNGGKDTNFLLSLNQCCENQMQ